MINVLFWNIKYLYNKERIDFLNNSIKYDIIILAEAPNRYIDTAITDFSMIQPVQNSGTKWIKIFKNNANQTFTLTRKDGLFRNRVVLRLQY